MTQLSRAVLASPPLPAPLPGIPERLGALRAGNCFNLISPKVKDGFKDKTPKEKSRPSHMQCDCALQLHCHSGLCQGPRPRGRGVWDVDLVRLQSQVKNKCYFYFFA